MVLAELGSKISSALNKLNKVTVIDEETLQACLKDIATALLQSDVNVKYVLKLRENIKIQFKLNQESGANLRKLIQQSVVQELTQMLSCEKKPFVPKRGQPNIIMFVGLQGSGKTTTCTKYAYHWQKLGWKVALVCADTFRAGAFDQLKQNATKVRIPFYGSYTETDPVVIAQEGVSHFKKENYEMIIVDTSGRHKQEQELFDEMLQVQTVINPNDIIFIMDSSIGQACYDQALAFRKCVNVGSVIITKLDGHAKGGGALSAVAATESPIIFIGSGEHFNDFEQFDAQSFIRRLLGMGDVSKLFNVVKDAVSPEEQSKMMENLKTGNFTLNDLKGQYSTVLKLGSLNSFMSMIPGIGQNILSKGNEQESIQKVKRSLCILDSMTQDELKNKVPITNTRIIRIARGSGVNIQDVEILIDEHKKMKIIVEKFQKTNLGKGNESTNIQRNQSQIMGKLANIMDPSIINTLGGVNNIMGMMKEMGNMPGMENMMKQMMGGGIPGKGKAQTIKIKKR